MKVQKKWKELQAFYKMKAMLEPSFCQKNKRIINALESILVTEYQAEAVKYSEL